jgi:hypothetical protein
MIKEKYLIVQRISTVRGTEIVDREIKPVPDYPYLIEKQEAIKILQRNQGTHLALAVLIFEE